MFCRSVSVECECEGKTEVAIRRPGDKLKLGEEEL
jgi:hypothetical protein